MSNPKAWRAKKRTTKPNSRQKRNGLFLDAHRLCQRCDQRPAEEAHHMLLKGHPDRYDWQFLEALCVPCHIAVHQQMRIVVVISSAD